MQFRNLLFGFVCTLAVGTVSGQAYRAALEKAAARQTEKLYIHYDKEYYVAGETMWFKAYFYSNSKPSGLSTSFYIQFADSKGNIVSSNQYPVMGAVAKGSISVPDSLPQGNYYLRAFTPVMLNSGEDMVYRKNIFVFRPSNNSTASAKPGQNVTLSFFPESGYLVDGILSVLGFKASDQNGMPVDIDGVIRTEEGTTIASFRSYHDGIGKVQFKPQAGKKYIAEVETAAGKRVYQLPEVQASGINIKIQDEKGGKKFQLSRSEKDKAKYDNLSVVAEMNNSIVYQAEIAFEDYPSIIGHLVTDSLPSGILHFTVFNADGMPLAERLSFVDNGEYRSAADIVMEKTGIEKRALNTIDLKFAGNIQRSCSISVMDLSGDSFNDEDNIWSRMLLTSDLKGYIHNPAWYFRQNVDSVKSGIDNLLLTHGWSRYNWTALLGGNLPAETVADPGYLTITGKVIDPQSKNPLGGGKLGIVLEAGDSSPQNLEVTIDAAGRFRLDSLSFNGMSNLLYGYTDSKGKIKPALVVLDKSAFETFASKFPAGVSGFPAKTPGPGSSDYVKRRYDYEKSQLDKTKELQNVDLKSNSNKKPADIVNEKYATGTFKGESTVFIDNINDPVTDKSMNVVDYVRNRVQQIEIQNGRFVNRKNMSLMSGQKWLIGVFLNDQPVEMAMLRTIRAGDVAIVKFFDAGFSGGGSATPGGALAIYTKEKFVEDAKLDKLESVSYRGYNITKEFYNPDYSKADPRHQAADRRTTLYWNPDVLTDAQTTNIKVNFYNNDFTKKYRIVVEGFDAEGKLVHVEKIVGE